MERLQIGWLRFKGKGFCCHGDAASYCWAMADDFLLAQTSLQSCSWPHLATDRVRGGRAIIWWVRTSAIATDRVLFPYNTRNVQSTVASTCYSELDHIILEMYMLHRISMEFRTSTAWYSDHILYHPVLRTKPDTHHMWAQEVKSHI